MVRQYSLFRPRPAERALLVGVRTPGTSERTVRECLQELAQLAQTAGGQVVGQVVFRISRPDPAFFITRGKAEALAAEVGRTQAVTAIFDDELSPVQTRNLERLLRAQVIDRTQVILDIFALLAHTRAGRLQVGLAQLEYMLPRLRRMWTHLERQRGGIGVRGGPGEQQIEVDRRRIKTRIAQLRKELRDVERHREQLRKNRRRHGWTLVSLVGYTNAGKSTLLNRLTGSTARVNDTLFVTLDPMTRRLNLPDHSQVLLTDTVGFIRKLPHQLVEAFHATLEEVHQADLLLHVVDSSHPEAELQIEAVHGVLREIGVTEPQMIGVLNKIDRPGAAERARRLARLFERAVPVSARDGQGIEELRAEISDMLRSHRVEMQVRIPMARGDLLALVRASGQIVRQQFNDGYVDVVARVPLHLAGRLKQMAQDEAHSHRNDS